MTPYIDLEPEDPDTDSLDMLKGLIHPPVYLDEPPDNPDDVDDMLHTVGFYTPDGLWKPESDWDNKEKAAERVNFLNGGKDNK